VCLCVCCSCVYVCVCLCLCVTVRVCDSACAYDLSLCITITCPDLHQVNLMLDCCEVTSHVFSVHNTSLFNLHVRGLKPGSLTHMGVACTYGLVDCNRRRSLLPLY